MEMRKGRRCCRPTPSTVRKRSCITNTQYCGRQSRRKSWGDRKGRIEETGGGGVLRGVSSSLGSRLAQPIASCHLAHPSHEPGCFLQGWFVLFCQWPPKVPRKAKYLLRVATRIQSPGYKLSDRHTVRESSTASCILCAPAPGMTPKPNRGSSIHKTLFSPS